MIIPGPVYAILTAVCWAAAVILFKRSGESFDPVALNLFKNIIGLVLMIATIPLVGASFESMSVEHVVTLAVAGAVGIGLADTLFFFSLNALGATRQAIVDCSYSPFIVVYAYLVLGESLNGIDLIGGGFIVAAMLLAVAQRPTGSLTRRTLWMGLFFGTGAMATMGLSIVWVKPILEQYDVLPATTVRLAGGTLSMLPLLVVRSIRTRAWAIFVPQPAWRYAVPATLLGTYFSLLFWIAGFKYNDASVASLLNQTSTVFVVVFAAVFLRERPTPRALMAVGLGVAGSILVILPWS